MSCEPPPYDSTNPCSDFDLSDADENQNWFSVSNSCAQVNNAAGLRFVYPDQVTAACNAIAGDEWTAATTVPGEPCSFLKNYPGHEAIPGCKSGGTGSRTFCQRTAYTGDLITCCVNDNNFWADNQGPNPPTCYSDSSKSKTCSPSSRDVTSSTCQGNIEVLCTSKNRPPDDISWISNWIGTENSNPFISDLPPCVYAVQRNLFLDQSSFTLDLTMTDQNIPPIRSSSGLFWAKQLMNQVAEDYTNAGFSIGSMPGDSGFNSFQNTLYSICQNIPGLCEDFIFDICSSQTTDSIINTPSLVQWCGCYLPDSEYAVYANEFRVAKECTPICNIGTNIRNATTDGTGKVTCDQNICIMDGTTVDFSDSSIIGDVTFSQVCGSCDGVCNCIISDTTIAVVEASLDGVDLSQACGAEPRCFQTVIDPKNGEETSVQIPCNSTDPVEDALNVLMEEDEREEARQRNLIITIGIIALIVLLLIGGAVLLYLVFKD